jgi:hypothetical protein
LRRLLEESGLGYIPTPPIRTSSALLRALGAMKENRLLLEIYDDVDETAWELDRVTRGSKTSRYVQLQQDLIVTYHKVRGADDPPVTYSSVAAQEQIEPLLQHYMQSYLGTDIAGRVLLAAVQKAAGFSMRPGGGMYLILSPGAAIVERLQDFIGRVATEFNPGAHLTALPIPDTEETAPDVRYHSHQALIAQLNGSLRQLRDMLRDGRFRDDGHSKVAPKTVARYLEDVDRLGNQAVICREVAKLQVEEIDAALDKLRAAYTSVLNGTMMEADYKATLASVEHAIDEAEEAGVQPLAQQIGGEETSVE